MKVILLKKVKGLGDIDMVKEVAEGYAKNFLFPNNLAVQATDQAVKAIGDRQRKEAKRSVEDLQHQQSLAGQLDGMEVELKEKANEKGVLYAAVTAQKLSAALKKLGYNVGPEQFPNLSLKNVGNHAVSVKFGHGLEAELQVIIQAVS